MTDDELEQRLLTHYRTIDPAIARPALGIRIGDALDRRSKRRFLTTQVRHALATAAAALLIVAVGLGLGLQPGGFLTRPPAPSTATDSVTPSPTSSIVATATPTVTPVPDITRQFGDLSFVTQADWNIVVAREWSAPIGPRLFLSNAPIADPCAAAFLAQECWKPLAELPADGILVTLSGSALLGLPNPTPVPFPQSVGAPCSAIGGERQFATAFQGFVLSACLRGPDFAANEAAFARLVASVKRVPPDASPSPSLPSPSPTDSIPPVPAASWTHLDLAIQSGGPVRVTSVVPGGDVVLGEPSAKGVLPGWYARNAYVALPDDTFGPASIALAAPCGDQVLVAIQSPTGGTTIWRSHGGATWVSSPSPAMRIARDSDLAGNQTGAIAILADAPDRLAFSADGVTWRIVSLPGGTAVSVQGVAAFGTGFVAVGESGAKPGSPIAWWSDDGLTWTRAAVQAHPGDGFDRVNAGSNGLVAISTTGLVPGLASFWTSSDGRSWKVSTADPLGVWHGGEGEGSANGIFSGDGIRLLGYGIRRNGGPTEYWTSLDGTHWTRLTLAGDMAAATAGQVTPFLLSDGILFSGDKSSWFGLAVP